MPRPERRTFRVQRFRPSGHGRVVRGASGNADRPPGQLAIYIHFIADANGRVVIEIYNNTADPIPDYASMHPLRFHIAFLADDPDGIRAALEAAGATFVEEQKTPDGSRLLMLRDPWGLPLQLAKRATPLMPPA